MLRNFWVDAEIDEHKTPMTGGPTAKDGGMRLTVHIRQDGHSEIGAVIRCRAREDGRLTVRVVPGPNVRVDGLGSRRGFVVESTR